MMRSSTLLLLAAVLGSACSHAPTPATSAPTASTASTASTIGGGVEEPDDPEPETELLELAVADPNTEVVVMEADDLGGGADAIVATPKRPDLPSMMTDIAMAPSH